MKVGSSGNWGSSREYSKLFYSWCNCPLINVYFAHPWSLHLLTCKPLFVSEPYASIVQYTDMIACHSTLIRIKGNCLPSALLYMHKLSWYTVELVRSIGGLSYCSYRRQRRALEPPLQLSEFGENVNKATSSIIRHVFCLAYVFPTWDPIEIAR